MISTIMGVNICLLRSERKMSTEELSRVAKIPIEDLNLIECGERRATSIEVLALSTALGVKISALFHGWEQANKSRHDQ